MNAPKKPSKLETLTASLAHAEAALNSAKARLQPQIDVESARVDTLRRAYNKAEKASDVACKAFRDTQATTQQRLASQDEQVRASIVEALAGKFPNADVNHLVREKQAANVGADPAVATANAAFNVASAAKDKAYTAWSIANSPGGVLAKLGYELSRYEDTVARLQTEINRLPRYRDAAKARRDEAKQEQLRDAATQAAREFLKKTGV